MIFSRHKSLRALMRPLNRRLRYRRYVLLFIICVFFTLIFNGLHKQFTKPDIEQYKDDLNKELIPYYLIEKNHITVNDFNRVSLEEHWLTKNAYKLDRDSINQNNIKIRTQNGRPKSDLDKPNYVIYEHTKFFHKSKYCHLFDSSENDHDDMTQLYTNECPYKNCQFTCDKEQAYTADAVLFSEWDLTELIKEYKTNELNEIRNLKREQRQIWILWNTIEAKLKYNDFDAFKFNWTISYRQDSEVSDCASGCIYGTKEYVNILEFYAIISHQKFIENEFSKRKDQLIVIINDVCIDEYLISFLIKLNEFFTIKFYGKCKNSKSSLSIFQSSNSGDRVLNLYQSQLGKISVPCEHGSLCERELLVNNKFLFLQDAQNCTDYISKTFWRALDFGIIPVAFYPAKIFYEKIAPKNSYIHVEDFNYDYNKLSEHLTILSNNYTLYLNYFKWKFYLATVSDQIHSEKRLMCELCYRLNNETSSIYYESINKWYNNDCN